LVISLIQGKKKKTRNLLSVEIGGKKNDDIITYHVPSTKTWKKLLCGHLPKKLLPILDFDFKENTKIKDLV
jgi:hypothetical protein